MNSSPVAGPTREPSFVFVYAFAPCVEGCGPLSDRPTTLALQGTAPLWRTCGHARRLLWVAWASPRCAALPEGASNGFTPSRR
jgi:hypothetical protein